MRQHVSLQFRVAGVATRSGMSLLSSYRRLNH